MARKFGDVINRGSCETVRRKEFPARNATPGAHPKCCGCLERWEPLSTICSRVARASAGPRRTHSRGNNQFTVAPPQHFLYFFPDPHGNAAFRPTLGALPIHPVSRLSHFSMRGGRHTPTMTLKNAALQALIGTILMTAPLVWTFVFNFLNLLRGLVPAVTLFSSFIYALGCFSVMVFFFVFHRAQS
jgi:hypothetical protein